MRVIVEIDCGTEDGRQLALWARNWRAVEPDGLAASDARALCVDYRQRLRAPGNDLERMYAESLLPAAGRTSPRPLSASPLSLFTIIVFGLM